MEGDNSTCEDCAGTINGNAYFDKCDICDDNPDNDCIKIVPVFGVVKNFMMNAVFVVAMVFLMVIVTVI